MEKFNPNNLWINYRLSNMNQLQPRRYTLTHSDETAELFLTVGPDFNCEKLSSQRDEVIGEWQTDSLGQYYFYIFIHVDNVNGAISSVKRNEIFTRELPLALKAIKHGDPCLFLRYPQFLNAPIYVYFQSQDSSINRTECYGCFNDY